VSNRDVLQNKANTNVQQNETATPRPQNNSASPDEILDNQRRLSLFTTSVLSNVCNGAIIKDISVSNEKESYPVEVILMQCNVT